MLQVAGKSINFLIDMGATYLVLPSFGGTLHPSQVSLVGIDGTSSRPLQTGPQPCQLDHFLFTHSFLRIPSPIVDPTIWDTEIPLVATQHTHIQIKLRDPSHFPSRPQFLISHIHLCGLKPIIDRLLGHGLLVPTASPCNTPILPVRKVAGGY